MCVLAAPDELGFAKVELSCLAQLFDLFWCQADFRTFPDDLGVKVAVALARLAARQGEAALIGDGFDRLQFFSPLGGRLQLCRRDVLARCARVLEGIDLFG